MEGETTSCPGCGAVIGESGRCLTCGYERAEDHDDPLIGRTIGDKYLVRSLLGSGAMGRVYRAEHTVLERIVALKVLHPHLVYNESLVHRFLREARAASKLAHPNIVTLLDFGQDTGDGLLYLVMELLEGRPLESIVEEEGALELERVYLLSSQILLALDEAHALGVVHRDLKPENIIVLPTRRGERVKVVDFGLAQLMGRDDPKLTSTGLVCGTPSYISPEQARSANVGPSTDIYSFGILLYEMVTGVLPFDATGAYEMVSKHLTEIPPRPEIQAPELRIPQQLSDLIMRCLEKSPDQRFDGAAELLDALMELSGFAGLQKTPTGQVHPAPHRKTPAPKVPVEHKRRCPTCDLEMPGQARFCGACGADMDTPVIRCSICGVVANPGDTHCSACGVPVSPTAGARTPLSEQKPARSPVKAELKRSVAPADPSLQRLRKFVPQGVLEAIIHGDDLLKSQRRQVTVLFAEITGLDNTGLDPEEMVRVVNRCFDALVESVNQLEGTVDKFIGDCVMAVFGAPVCHEDDPLRAVQSAFAMRRAIDQLDRRLPFQIGLRIGVNAGTVVAEAVGSTAQLDYTVVGETVRLAQKLEGVASPGQILVSEEVYSGCQRSLEFRPLPSVRLEGAHGRIPVFEPVEPGEDQEPGLDEDHLPTTFLVGRTAERATVEQAGRQVTTGHGAAIIVTGEPGIGKTALLVHAAEDLRAQGLRTHLIRARPPTGGGTAAFGLLLRSVVGCPPDATAAQVQSRLGGLEGLDETDRGALAFLALSSRSSASLPAGAIDLTCLTAVRRLLKIVTAGQPTAILLDDSRYLGNRERYLLTQLIGSIGDLPLLLIIADREPDPALLDVEETKLLELDPLHPAESERLLGKLAGGRPVDAVTARRVLESSGGNPLYLVETARYLHREGHLVTDAPRRRSEPPDITIPGNLRALVVSRFDSLEPAARTVLVHAALIGRAFTASLLARLLPGQRDLHETLDHLEEIGLLELEDVESTAPRLKFRHELVRETLCDTLTLDRRQKVHERLATLLLDGADPEMPPGEIGRQLELAKRDVDAVGQYQLAADELAERGEPEEAARYLRRALQALTRSDSNDAVADLEIQLARALNRAGHWHDARTTALEARNKALVAGDVILAARASLELARGAAEQGDLPLAGSMLSEAYHTALECGEMDLAAQLASDLGEVQERSGQLDQALQTLEGAYKRLEAAARRTRTSQSGAAASRVAEVLNRLGRVMLRKERTSEAIDHLELALKHSRICIDSMLEGRVLGNLGQAQAMDGDRGTALQTLDRALLLLQRAGDRVGTAKLLHNMARLHFETGERDRAEALARESFALSVEIGWSEGEAMTAAFLDQIG